MSKQLAFIHIPKTGGSYITQSKPVAYDVGADRFHYQKGAPVISGVRSLGHCIIQGDKKIECPQGFNIDTHKSKLTDKLTFSIVRNPFSWLVSYAGHAGCEWGQFSHIEYPKNSKCIPHDYDLAQKGFDYLIRSIADRDEGWPSRHFLFSQLFDTDGNMVVDWILKQESLDDDLRALAEHTGVGYKKQGRVRVSEKANPWTFDLIKLVNNTWHREWELFGYSDKCSVLGSGPVDKSLYKYNWETDCLEQL